MADTWGITAVFRDQDTSYRSKGAARAAVTIMSGQVRPDRVRQPAEFAVIYGISTVAAGMAAQDQVQYLLPMWVYPFRASQTEDMGPFRKFIAPWLIPHDPSSKLQYRNSR